MMAADAPLRLAYLAPEIPALSATFVYEELLALERCGYSVLPVSVRRPAAPARDQSALARRTHVLYQGSSPAVALAGLAGLIARPGRAWRALPWLAADMAELGWLRLESWKLGFQFLAAVRLARLLMAQGCGHLHVHFAHVPAQIAMYASAMAGIPFTVTGHANDIFERGLLLARKARRARKFLTISEYNRDHLRRLGVDDACLAVVRCGVSLPPAASRPPAQRKAHYRIGTLGRLVEKKGMDVLIRVIASLQQRGHSIELSVAGDGPLRAELEALARQLGVAASVRFEGAMGHDRVAIWMLGLDAFVLACKVDAHGDMDGIPVVLMEAMSQGVPVVSTRLSGIPELVIHESTGLLAEPGDADELAAQIGRLIDSAELRDALTQAARSHVEAEFGQEANLARLTVHFGVDVATGRRNASRCQRIGVGPLVRQDRP